MKTFICAVLIAAAFAGLKCAASDSADRFTISYHPNSGIDKNNTWRVSARNCDNDSIQVLIDDTVIFSQTVRHASVFNSAFRSRQILVISSHVYGIFQNKSVNIIVYIGGQFIFQRYF